LKNIVKLNLVFKKKIKIKRYERSIFSWLRLTKALKQLKTLISAI